MKTKREEWEALFRESLAGFCHDAAMLASLLLRKVHPLHPRWDQAINSMEDNRKRLREAEGELKLLGCSVEYGMPITKVDGSKI